MKGKYLLRGIGGFVLSALLLLGVSMSSASTVNAQRGFHGGGFHGGRSRGRIFIGPRFGFGPGRYGYGPYGYPYSYYSKYVFGDSQAANSQGYEDGLKTGTGDARHHRSNDPERSHYFKDAGFGNFAQDYREGFERGYSAGFSG